MTIEVVVGLAICVACSVALAVLALLKVHRIRKLRVAIAEMQRKEHEASLQAEALAKENARLAKYSAIIDAEGHAAQLIEDAQQEATRIGYSARIDAGQVGEAARVEAEKVVAEAKEGRASRRPAHVQEDPLPG